jgi:hypothetical protein
LRRREWRPERISSDLEKKRVEARELRPLEARENLLHLLPRVRAVQRQLAQHL